MSQRDAVLATLEEYSAAYCDKDLDRLMAIFVDGEEISLIGTGADELCSGRDAVAAGPSRDPPRFRTLRKTLGLWEQRLGGTNAPFWKVTQSQPKNPDTHRWISRGPLRKTDGNQWRKAGCPFQK